MASVRKGFLFHLALRIGCVIIPPQTVFVGGYTVFTLSVRPSVRPLHFVFLITLRVMDGISSNLAYTFIFTGQIFIIKIRGRGHFYESYFPL